MLERPVRRHLVRLLDSLPVIAHFAGRLELQAIIDQTCPSRSNAQLAPGQVALAIIANRLTQPKDMYQLLTWTQQWGVREVFGFDPPRSTMIASVVAWTLWRRRLTQSRTQ